MSPTIPDTLNNQEDNDGDALNGIPQDDLPLTVDDDLIPHSINTRRCYHTSRELGKVDRSPGRDVAVCSGNFRRCTGTEQREVCKKAEDQEGSS
jgi:hypothetical protein